MSVNKYNPTSGRLEPIAGGTLYADAPIGSVIYTYETEERDDWLFVRGQTLSREEYSGLFNWAVSRNLLETTAGDGKPFGLGDGSTTFTLPNLSGEFVRVTGTNSHTDQGDGGTIGQHQDATEQPNFSGNNGSFYFDPSFLGNTKNPDKTASGNSYQYFANSSSSGSQTIVKSFSTRPTNTSLNAMIKAKQTPVPADFISEVDAVTADLQDDIDQLQIEVDQLPKGVVPKGTVTFANLPSLASVEIGWMYNVSDAFTTTSDFVTPGIPEGASSNVYCINTGTNQSPVKKWDVFAAAPLCVLAHAKETDSAESKPQGIGVMPFTLSRIEPRPPLFEFTFDRALFAFRAREPQDDLLFQLPPAISASINQPLKITFFMPKNNNSQLSLQSL